MFSAATGLTNKSNLKRAWSLRSPQTDTLLWGIGFIVAATYATSLALKSEHIYDRDMYDRPNVIVLR